MCISIGLIANIILLALDSGNKANLERIEKSLFVLCLDGTPHIQENNHPSSLADLHYTVTSAEAIHGGGSKSNSGNRWFDKILQVNSKRQENIMHNITVHVHNILEILDF